MGVNSLGWQNKVGGNQQEAPCFLLIQQRTPQCTGQAHSYGDFGLRSTARIGRVLQDMPSLSLQAPSLAPGHLLAAAAGPAQSAAPTDSPCAATPRPRPPCAAAPPPRGRSWRCTLPALRPGGGHETEIISGVFGESPLANGQPRILVTGLVPTSSLVSSAHGSRLSSRPCLAQTTSAHRPPPRPDRYTMAT